MKIQHKIIFSLALIGLSASVNAADLASPTLLKPDNNANLPLKKAAKFTWQKVTGATKYRLIFSNDKNFANYDAKNFKCLNTKTCFLYTTITATSYNVAATQTMLKTDGNYFWQVQSVGKIATDNSKIGEVRAFSVGISPPVDIDETSMTSVDPATNTQTITDGSYTKIANDGSILPDNAILGPKPTDWACTKDNNTGLIWEIKTTDGGLRDVRKTYTWYNPDSNTNGYKTYAGYKGLNNKYYKLEDFVGDKNNGQNTEDYTKKVNALTDKESLCGANDWRLPTKDELTSLIYCSNGKYKTLDVDDSDHVCIGSVNYPMINTTYFPDVSYGAYWFWSSSPSINYRTYAARITFTSSANEISSKNSDHFVRLVRTSKQ